MTGNPEGCAALPSGLRAMHSSTSKGIPNCSSWASPDRIALPTAAMSCGPKMCAASGPPMGGLIRLQMQGNTSLIGGRENSIDHDCASFCNATRPTLAPISCSNAVCASQYCYWFRNDGRHSDKRGTHTVACCTFRQTCRHACIIASTLSMQGRRSRQTNDTSNGAFL